MTDNIIIRAIQPGDNADLAMLIRKVIEEYNVPKCGTVYSDPTTDDLYSLFRKERSVFWVAELNGKIAGGCGIYPTKGLPQDCAELVKFYVSGNARRKGIGSALIEKSIASAKAAGYTRLYLESLPQFAEAVHMYEKLGFENMDAAMGDSGHSSCNLWMIK
ncbi:MAG: GNAT family N-acetyltransferase [Ferruginibacter sp.]